MTTKSNSRASSWTARSWLAVASSMVLQTYRPISSRLNVVVVMIGAGMGNVLLFDYCAVDSNVRRVQSSSIRAAEDPRQTKRRTMAMPDFLDVSGQRARSYRGRGDARFVRPPALRPPARERAHAQPRRHSGPQRSSCAAELVTSCGADR